MALPIHPCKRPDLEIQNQGKHPSRELAPWYDMSDLARRTVVVWEGGHLRAHPEEWSATFGPQHEAVPKRVAPARILYAFVPLRPWRLRHWLGTGLALARR